MYISTRQRDASANYNAGFRITRYFYFALWGVRKAHENCNTLQIRGKNSTGIGLLQNWSAERA
jgi:hypothetical protein